MKLSWVLTVIILSTYVSSPAHVPNFDNFTTPVLQPGESGIFNFTIENRYVGAMKNVVLNVEIYMWAIENECTEIDRLEAPPIIEESGDFKYTLNLGEMNSGEIKPVVFHIKTFSHTPEGVYFVRFSLFFLYNGSEYKMWSRGYFSNDVWDNATKNHQLNLTYLSNSIGDQVNGIVPDSSFSVKRSLTWLLYILIGITAIVGAAAVYTYLKEERQKITKIDEEIYRLKGKYRELEERIKKKKKNQ